MFEKVDPRIDFPKNEKKLIKFWDEREIVKKTVEKNEGQPDFVVYDGPPGTNGMPHAGHMMPSALKDLWPKYKTMRGFRVLRKAGWDTHGLPIELQAEKELGLKCKEDIESYGLKKYVGYCRDTVFRYRDEWEKMIKRLGRFLDFENEYATLTNDYIQTDWWVIKQANEKGLLYKDYRITPYCARCGTGLSSHEMAQGYEDITEQAPTVKFKVKGEDDLYILVWTTTPWTLVGNVALAFGPEILYVTVKVGDERWIMAKDRLEELGDVKYEVVEEKKGADYDGLEYDPLYDYVESDKKGFYVIADEFVTAEDGTGVVHLALYGEDDYRLIKKYDLPMVQHIDLSGHLGEDVKDWKGTWFKDLDQKVLQDLEERKILFKKESQKHSYPHCWRCDKPLMYFAKSSWFIKTTAIKDKMIKANSEVNWYPGHIKAGRFGKWLENNIDWAVSRERFWGSPIPIWQCGECNEYLVVGSVAELNEHAKEKVDADFDLHRPNIDEVKLECPECSGEMTREPDVLDCWFNAGVMPWGQWGYPAKEGSAELVKSQFPADFIAEAIDQTRGWFYTLLAVSVLLEDESCFRNVICHEHIVDEKGKKMSKSVGNVIEPVDVMNKTSADAVRWTLYNQNPWIKKRYSEKLLR